MAYEDLQATSISPISGATYLPATVLTARMNFEMSTPRALPLTTFVDVEIAAENVAGQDGTLADDKVLGLGQLMRRDSDPSHWYGSASGPWMTPGTYFFQYSAKALQLYGDKTQVCPAIPVGSTGTCVFASPVYTVTIRAPSVTPVTTPPSASGTGDTAGPSFTLSLATARVTARRYAVRHLNAKRPTVTCTRWAYDYAVCAVRWRSAGRRRSAKIDVTRDEDTGRYAVDRHP